MPANIELAGVAPSLNGTTKTQETPAAAWDALRDLVDIVDYMLADMCVLSQLITEVVANSSVGRYSFDAPKRTVVEDYDLVTRNMLTIQSYTDDMPSPLRITAALRGQEPCLAFLQ